jgi:hypothetical protein
LFTFGLLRVGWATLSTNGAARRVDTLLRSNAEE